jgi:hypothetical protein
MPEDPPVGIPPLVPNDHYAQLFALKDSICPPAGVFVFGAQTAWSIGEAEPGFMRFNGLVLGVVEPDSLDHIDGYVATYSVLDVAIHVVWLYEAAYNVPTPQRVPDSFRRIWPSPTTFTWPPGPALTARGLQYVGGQRADGTE